MKEAKQANISKDIVIKSLQNKISEHEKTIETRDQTESELRNSIKSSDQALVSIDEKVKSLEPPKDNPFSRYRSQPKPSDETQETLERQLNTQDLQGLFDTQTIDPDMILGDHTTEGVQMEGDNTTLEYQHLEDDANVSPPRNSMTTENVQTFTSPVGDTRDLFPPTPTPAPATDPGSGHQRTSNSSARRKPGSSSTFQSALSGLSHSLPAATNKFAASERGGEASTASTQESNINTSSDQPSQEPSIKNKSGTNLKRASADAHLESVNEPKTKKRVGKSATRGLGPIIGDSQSPDPIVRAKQGGRSKRASKDNQKG